MQQTTKTMETLTAPAPKTRKPRAAKQQPESRLQSFFVGEIKEVYAANIPLEDMPKISSSAEVMRYAREIWEPCTLEIFECFYILLLNRSNRVCGWSQISKGGTAGTVADPKLIFRRALACGASGIILAHNHPSGNLTPSGADLELTKKLKEAGRFLEIQILDHLILTESNYMSFADEGHL
jgi:DNA repair protein RadC